MLTQPNLLVRILIVEDDPVMQLGLEYALAKHPQCQIIGQCTDGEAAIALASQLQPDLILMDIGLPHLDGIAATQQIKAQQLTIRIMMLTSHKTEHETIAALASGADAYCIKGASLEKLLSAIACIQDGGIYLDPQIASCVVKILKLPTIRAMSTNCHEGRVATFLNEAGTRFAPDLAAQRNYAAAATVREIRCLSIPSIPS